MSPIKDSLAPRERQLGFILGAVIAAIAMWFLAPLGALAAPLAVLVIAVSYYVWSLVAAGQAETPGTSLASPPDWHLATIEALARAIDAKYHPSQPYTRRVQVYAAGLAKAVGLSPDEVQGVRTAALLRDIGELAVPEHILSKPGPLTQEQFQKVRIHPQVGTDIIASVQFPYPVAPLILSHHERWDGAGYPSGLAGEQIPIGARILTIVDYFDAVITERPHRRALSREDAIAVLHEEAGRALDPTLVATFISVLPSLLAEYVADGQRADAQTPADALERGKAFENIALANREINALYEIAQTMGTSLGVRDTMALISSKLSKIVPWSGCALFLYESDLAHLRCRFADGLDAAQLLNTTLAAEKSLAGAGPQKDTVVNADPRVTFEAAGISEPTTLKSAIVCPLYYERTLIGCLELYHTVGNRYTTDHGRLLEQVAEQAGAVVHNSIVFEQTQEDSLTDPLTALPNRRSLFVHLSRELARAERLSSEVALVVMDVDGFKDINDTYGHQIGDAALREVSAALRAALRPYDLCVRFAGDEFIVVLSNCSRDDAETKRREFQTRLSEISLAAAPGQLARLTVSAGAAVFPHDGATYDALVAAADRRMYLDKAARRGEMRMAHRRSLPDPTAPRAEAET
jgi:diguanylate cyclase (GGDEF)-like protein